MPTERSDTVQSKSLEHNRVIALLRVVGAISLLSYHLLPNTIWAILTPNKLFLQLTRTTPYTFDYLLLAAFGITAPVLFFRSIAKNHIPPTLWIATAGYLAPIVASLAFYKDYPYLAEGLGAMLIAFGTGLLAALVSRSSERTIFVLCLIGALQAIYAVYYQHQQINTMVSGDIYRAGGTYDQPIILYTVMMIIIPLAVSAALKHQQTQLHFFYMTAASVMFATLVLSWGRGGMLALVVGLIWLTNKLLPSRISRIGTTIALSLILCFVCFHRVSSNINIASASRSNDSRLVAWRNGIDVFKNNWLTGVGIGDLNIPTRTLTRDARHMTLTVMSEPKNLILDWMDEIGISGIVLLVIFVLGIREKLRDAGNSYEALGIAAAWITILVAGIFDTPFGSYYRNQANALVACLFGATCLLRRAPQ